MSDLHTAALTTDTVDLLRHLPGDPREIAIILATTIAYVAAKLEVKAEGEGYQFNEAVSDMMDMNINSSLFREWVVRMRQGGEG